MQRPLLWIVAALLVVFLIAPLLLLLPMSFSSSESLHFPPPGFSLQWYDRFLDPDRPWLSAALTSIAIALSTAAVASTLGILAAVALVRGNFPGKGLANLFIVSPLITPVVVVAIGMFVVFVRIGVAGTPVGLVAAHTVLAVPLVVIIVSASLRSMERNLEAAATSLGAGPLRTFWYVTLPLTFPGVASAALFAFIISWDEVVTAIFLTSPTFKTLPVVMWSQVRAEVDPTIAAAAVVLLVVTTTIMGVALLLFTRRPHPQRVTSLRVA